MESLERKLLKNNFKKVRLYYCKDVICTAEDLPKVILMNRPDRFEFKFMKELNGTVESHIRIEFKT